MKKLISVILTAAMVLSACPAVMAQTPQAVEQEAMQPLLESVKERVSVPEECSEFSSSISTRYGYTAYSFYWSSEDNTKRFSIECCDDGIITGYTTSGFSAGQFTGNPSLPAISVDEAEEIAEDFAKTINPDFPYEIKVKEGNGNLMGNYSIELEIYINGIRFSNGSSRVSIDRNSGEVTNFYLDYMPCEFPSVENAIDIETAEKAYSEKLGLDLVYRVYTDENGSETAYPVYTQVNDYGKYINALTGDVIDAWSYMSYSAGGAQTAEKNSVANDSLLTEQEIAEIEKINGLISKTDIEQLVRDNNYLGISDDMKVQSVYLRKLYDESYAYNITMGNEDSYAHIDINAVTGEITGFSKSVDSDAEAETQADEIIKAFAGDKADEYRYEEEENLYRRYVNDIPVVSDYISVIIKDGELASYNITYTDCTFPDLEGAMGKEEAEKAMFDNTGYEMVYILVYAENTVTAAAIYHHESVNINPFTGKLVDYRNQEISAEDSIISYSDIDGHYAEDYINTLADFGIGFSGGEFYPDEKITQKDFLALLTAVYSSGIIVLKNDTRQSDNVYMQSVNNDIISEEERDDNAAVTRDSAAVYMIRAMGAEEYAKYEDIYVPVFSDVTRNKGYVALLNAMGVVHGDENNNFCPDREITRAESAVMIYNYLTR